MTFRSVRRFIDVEITPAVEVFSKRIHELKDAKQRLNAEKILEEYRKGRVFIDTLLTLMREHKDRRMDELEQVLLR